MFYGLENRIAQAVFGIPAVKGIEFGSGFAAAEMKGSENNDAYRMVDGEVKTLTNHAGGVLGGMSTGAPVVFRVAMKPTPSIYKPQLSVDLKTMRDVEFTVKGRHDPCVVLRAVPCVEAAAAVALYDALSSEEEQSE
jgi:chorismate synthase